MKLVATKNNVLIEPILNSTVRANEAAKRSGLIIPRPQNKLMDFEGIPNQGSIYSLAPDYEGELAVGDHVVFIRDEKPTAIKHDGLKLFRIPVDKIVAKVG